MLGPRPAYVHHMRQSEAIQYTDINVALCASGESYAGIYVPTLAQTILQGNDAGQEPAVNIQVWHDLFHLLLRLRVAPPPQH